MGFTTTEATSILTEKTNNIYIGLSQTTPTENGGNFTEPSASSGYERSYLSSTDRDLSISAQISNKKIIFFNESIGAGYGTVTHFGLFKTASITTPFFTGPLAAPLTIAEGYIPIFRAHKFVIALDKEVLEEYES